jgi:hypothetical protein
MPRSYSFDHFTVPKTEQPVPERGRKKAKKTNGGGGGHTDIKYGKAHAQTEELYMAHQMEAQLQELAGISTDEPRMSKSSEDASEADPIDRMRKSAPIGANPTAELPDKFKLRDVWSDGMRHVRLLREGTKDVIHAAGFFFRMPRDMMRALLHRERHA